MTDLTKTQKIETGLVVVALFICVMWMIGDQLLGIDFARWYDIVASLCLFILMGWSLISNDLKRRRYITGLEKQKDQPCAHCGKNWHTKDDAESEQPAVFMRHRDTSCNCVDDHTHDCPAAPI